MTVRLRPAVPGDALAIAAIHTDGWRTGYAGLLPQTYLDGLRADDAVPRWEATLVGGGWTRHVVAEIDGEVVGFVGEGPCVDPDSPARPAPDGSARPGAWGEVWDLFVGEAARGRGVGGALLEAGLAGLRDRGYDDVVLWCLRGNARAEHVYSRAGFLRDGLARTTQLTPDFVMVDDRWRLGRGVGPRSDE